MDYMYRAKYKNIKIWLDLCTHCNAGCPQCHRTDPNGLKKQTWLPLIQWSLDMFKKAFPIETLKFIYEFQLCGTWGDPIMNKDIYKICEYVIKNSECLLMINTNGSLRNEFWWGGLGYLCRDRLNVFFDVDGTTQEMHSLYRQNTNLQKILDNMKALSIHSNATVYTIKFKHNQDFIEDIQELVSNYGCTTFYAFPSNRWESMSTLSFTNQKNEKFILEKIDD
ncbi:MAG: hypothetical protein CXT73_00030 [Methanobacteriota archaeon]|nr:MAG: hypothetical protein CXT73_00030 [Euryarchaeota archaeon]